MVSTETVKKNDKNGQQILSALHNNDPDYLVLSFPKLYKINTMKYYVQTSPEVFPKDSTKYCH